MLMFMRDGGPFMWLLLLIAVLILALSIRKFIQLAQNQETTSSFLESGINSIMFWGAVSAVIGFFAHYLGIYNAMLAIARAKSVSPAIVSQGYSMSLIPILAGLLIFIASALIWFLLRWRFKQLYRTQN